MNSANESLTGGKRNKEEPEVSRGDYGALVKSRALENKVHMQILGDYETYLDLRDKIAKKSRLKQIREELEAANLTSERRKELEAQEAAELELITRRSLDATLAAHQNMYKRASAAQKAEMSRSNAENIRRTREAAEEENDTKIQ